jgi:hypothetical protein
MNYKDEWATGKREGYAETPQRAPNPRRKESGAVVRFLHSLGGWLALTGVGLAAFTAYTNSWDFHSVKSNPASLIVFAAGLVLWLFVRPA